MEAIPQGWEITMLLNGVLANPSLKNNKKPRFVAFAHFCDRNTLIIAGFKVKVYKSAHKIPQYVTHSSQESTRSVPNTPLDWMQTHIH